MLLRHVRGCHQPLFMRVWCDSGSLTTCYQLRRILNEVCTKMCTKFRLHLRKVRGLSCVPWPCRARPRTNLRDGGAFYAMSSRSLALAFPLAFRFAPGAGVLARHTAASLAQDTSPPARLRRRTWGDSGALAGHFQRVPGGASAPLSRGHGEGGMHMRSTSCLFFLWAATFKVEIACYPLCRKPWKGQAPRVLNPFRLGRAYLEV